MPRHIEQRIVPYTPLEMYDLVSDVASYPDFIPWILSAHVYDHKPSEFYADLLIGAGPIQQSYSSHVIINRLAHTIRVTHTKGPFSHLLNHWSFVPFGDQHTKIDFLLDFELTHISLRLILQPFLNHAMSVMVAAFETRAAQLYGSRSL